MTDNKNGAPGQESAVQITHSNSTPPGFAYSIGQTITDNTPHQGIAGTWPEYADVFDCPDEQRSTEKGGRYLCGPMHVGQPVGKSHADHWRVEELAGPVAWAPFDFDRLTPGHVAPLVGWFGQHFRCVWYHTASSTADAPRIRVVVALNREVTPDERRRVCQAIGALLGPDYPRDPCQDRASQPLYLPLAGATVTRCDDAPPLDADRWLAMAPAVPAEGATTAAEPDRADWTDGPVDGWNGPTDDDELIERACRIPAGARAALTGRATFEQLWTADVDVLGQAYPDAAGQGRPYDSSSADMALAVWLLMLTGRDCERTLRLMQRSGLVREKYDRPDYLPRTITRALRTEPKVWDWGRGATAILVPTSDLDAAVDRGLIQIGTQDGIALLFARQRAGTLVYNHTRNCWQWWDGTRWRVERTELAFHFARDLARQANVGGSASMGSANFCRGVEAFARTDRSLAVDGADFDRDNYLLNTPGGTLDLRSGTLRPHDPADRITLLTGATPSRSGGAVFPRFLDEITQGDRELAEFHQVTLGACLSGAVEGHWMLFWIGAGRNGKNTLGDLAAEALGDYARKVPASVLMSKAHESHPTEIANLQGIRLAVSSEINEGEHWNEARINEITGDATLSARFMRGDLFTFKRTHKHLIFGNHRPQLRSVGTAIRSRLKIVPFRASFAGREDPDLPRRLREELDFVMGWLVEGHAKWLAAGRRLPHCAAVEAESADYFEAQSTVDMWLADRVQRIPNDERGGRQLPKASELYRDYATWKQSRGENPVSMTRWAESMRGFKREKSDGFRYRGLQLITPF